MAGGHIGEGLFDVVDADMPCHESLEIGSAAAG
jgi:hypothetical protein